MVHLWTCSCKGSPKLMFIHEYCKYTVSVINNYVISAWNNRANPLLSCLLDKQNVVKTKSYTWRWCIWGVWRQLDAKNRKCNILFINCIHSYLHTSFMDSVLSSCTGQCVRSWEGVTWKHKKTHCVLTLAVKVHVTLPARGALPAHS